MTKVYRIYLDLLKKYGKPRPWPWTRFAPPSVEAGRETRREDGTEPSTPFEICVGSILTQNTNWQNVEKALNNLKKAKALSVEKLASVESGELENYLRPSGFYRQKAERLQVFCRHICQSYGGQLAKLWKKDLMELRRELLSLKGIGPETADTILLYAGKKPIFVIDEYTRRFVKHHNLTSNLSYDGLQRFFMNNLPKSVKIYADYHALIVKDGKNNSNHSSGRFQVKS